jgi:ribosomal protein L7/L12
MKTTDAKIMLKMLAPQSIHRALDQAKTSRELFAVLETYRDLCLPAIPTHDPKDPEPKHKTDPDDPKAKICIYLTRINNSVPGVKLVAVKGIKNLTGMFLKDALELVNSVPGVDSPSKRVFVATIYKADSYKAAELFNRPGISWTWEYAP